MYQVEIRHDSTVSSKSYETESEAWDAKDAAHMMGFAFVRVIGAPMRGYAVVPKLPLLDIVD